jgi:hypothetical protein
MRKSAAQAGIGIDKAENLSYNPITLDGGVSFGKGIGV